MSTGAHLVPFLQGDTHSQARAEGKKSRLTCVSFRGESSFLVPRVLEA
jgi:hypothetical protein